MADRMVVDLGVNLDSVELNGMPSWTDGQTYELKSIPKRFASGDVLVWAQRENKRFVYVGIVRNARVVGMALHFDRFDRFTRPVAMTDLDGTDQRGDFYAEEKGYMNQFSYIPEEAFKRVLEASERSIA